MTTKETAQQPPPEPTEEQLQWLWLKHEEEKQLMLETMTELPEDYQLELPSQLRECHSR